MEHGSCGYRNTKIRVSALLGMSIVALIPVVNIIAAIICLIAVITWYCTDNSNEYRDISFRDDIGILRFLNKQI